MHRKSEKIFYRLLLANIPLNEELSLNTLLIMVKQNLGICLHRLTLDNAHDDIVILSIYSIVIQYCSQKYIVKAVYTI